MANRTYYQINPHFILVTCSLQIANDSIVTQNIIGTKIDITI